ncbi:MAG: shikimate kinase [Dehalococcoidia bacterium]|nr:shikimate kinase [Dehalococcoidia bacterium]
MSAANISLVGFMCAGKSTVGRRLAHQLNRTFIETDAVVEEETAMTIAHIFETQGEDAFRDLESKAIREACTATNTVIACGGGAVLRPDNVEQLRATSTVIYLKVSEEIVLERLGPASKLRPLLAGPSPEEKISTLLRYRLPSYERAAHLTVDTTNLQMSDVVHTILQSLREYESTDTSE